MVFSVVVSFAGLLNGCNIYICDVVYFISCAIQSLCTPQSGADYSILQQQKNNKNLPSIARLFFFLKIRT